MEKPPIFKSTKVKL